VIFPHWQAKKSRNGQNGNEVTTQFLFSLKQTLSRFIGRNSSPHVDSKSDLHTVTKFSVRLAEYYSDSQQHATHTQDRIHTQIYTLQLEFTRFKR
jgi:hypothetical protein